MALEYRGYFGKEFLDDAEMEEMLLGTVEGELRKLLQDVKSPSGQAFRVRMRKLGGFTLWLRLSAYAPVRRGGDGENP